MPEKFTHPLEAYLRSGITANDARQLLEARGCLEFPQFRSGMFPALNLENIDHPHTGMANAWLRDTSAVALALIEDGQTEIAARATYGVLECLKKIAGRMQQIVTIGHAPASEEGRPAVSFIGQDSEPRHDWPNDQNDAFGYVLQLIGKAASSNTIQLTD